MKEINKIPKKVIEDDCNFLRWELCKTHIHTCEIIAEIERRRPKDCANDCVVAGSQKCGSCLWGIFIGEKDGGITDCFQKIAKEITK